MRSINKILYRVGLVVSALVIVFTSQPVVGAVDESFKIGNGIYYYNPDDTCEPPDAGLGASSTGGAKGKITVAQANIKNMPNEVKMVAKENPDFISLNESGRSSIAELAPAGYEGYRDNSSFKNDAATNQAKSTSVFWLSERWSKVDAGRVIILDDGPQEWDAGRAITWVTLRDSEGGTASMVSIHHMINPNKYDNQAQRQVLYGKAMDKVVEKMRELSALGPVVLAGDLNFQIGDNNDYGPRKKLAAVNMQSTYDSLGRPPGVAVDYVFYTKNMVANRQWVIPDATTGSDHPYIFATLTADGSGAGAGSVVDGGGCVCKDPGSSSDTTLTGADNAEKIFNYFISKGLSAIQAAGIIGNMAIESGFDPQRIQGKAIGEGSKDPNAAGSGGWGLIQWTPGSKILPAANEAGLGDKPIYELSTQLDLVWGHMQNKPPITKGSFSIPEFKKITNIEAAVNYFEDKIEGAGEPNYPERYTAAKLALDEFGGNASTSPGATTDDSLASCDDVGAGASAGNAVQTAVNYAWPEYHAPNYTKMKTTYANAVSKAQSNGKYVGGGSKPGIDCGGFVTRVMQDSGLDPNYGGGGNTESQERYLVESGKYIKIENPTTANLKPGAIAISSAYGGDGGGHTYMFVGKRAGFETQIASASYSPSNTSWRTPMAGRELVADPNYNWYILK